VSEQDKYDSLVKRVETLIGENKALCNQYHKEGDKENEWWHRAMVLHLERQKADMRQKDESR